MTQDFSHIVDAHQARLIMLAYRMTGDHAQAEDITQEVFLKLHARHHTMHHRDALDGWLITATINAARDALRHRKSRAYIGPWLPSPIPTEERVDAHARADRLLGKEALNYNLLCLFEVLTPTQRATLLLRDLCGYSTAECADALAMSISSVKTTLHRARQALGDRGKDLWNAPSEAMHAQHTELLGRLMQALMAHDAKAVEALCKQDVTMWNDGGGEFISALRPIRSRAHVCRFFLARAPDPNDITHLELIECNGLMGVRMTMRQNNPRKATHTIMLLDVEESEGGVILLAQCHVVSATPKLAAFV